MGSLLQNTIFGRTKSKDKPFISTWKTDNIISGSSGNNQIKLPLVANGSYDFTVDWGDGTSSAITNYNNAIHTYPTSGKYTITILGKCIGWSFYNNPGDRLKILSVQKWGSIQLGILNSIVGFFYSCSNLTLTSVEDVLQTTRFTSFYLMFDSCTALTTINRLNEWDVSKINHMPYMFNNASSFNQYIGDWDTSSCTNMYAMFEGASMFNQDIGRWNTSEVQNMSNMFRSCPLFNQNIGSWNVSKVVDISHMFRNCTAFDQNLGSWNVSKVTNFYHAFNNCINFNNGNSNTINNWVINTASPVSLEGIFFNCNNFNQPLNNWNTSRVTTLETAFYSCWNFNQNIGNWNVENVISLSDTFANASSFNNGNSNTINNWKTTNVLYMIATFYGSGFNQPIGNWDTSKVIKMSNMFMYTNFNQDIENWNTGNVTEMYLMFNGANSFNQPLNAWDVSKVNQFSGMFAGANSFNMPLDNWNTESATNMVNMFLYAPVFDQNIGSWNVSNVTNFSNFMLGKTEQNFSAANLDAIYNGWSSRPISTSMTINFGTIKHTSASSSGKAILTSSPNNWTITDGGI